MQMMECDMDGSMVGMSLAMGNRMLVVQPTKSKSLAEDVSLDLVDLALLTKPER